MRKKNFRKWWRRLGFRKELRELDKVKVAEQELLETKLDIQEELEDVNTECWCGGMFCKDNF